MHYTEALKMVREIESYELLLRVMMHYHDHNILNLLLHTAASHHIKLQYVLGNTILSKIVVATITFLHLTMQLEVASYKDWDDNTFYSRAFLHIADSYKH